MDCAGGRNGVRAVARVIHTEGVPSRDFEVFTYVFPYYSSSITASEGAIVVNLRASFLSDMILSVSERGNYTEGPILVCGEDGRVVCGQAAGGFLADCTDEEFYQIASDSRVLSGSQDVTMGGERYAMTYSKTDKDGWIFIGLSPYAVAAAEINRLTLLIASIASAALAVAIAIAVAVTRRLYRPIEQLNRYVSSRVRLAQGERGRRSELEDVSRAFQQVYESAADLESRQRESSLARRNALIARVATGAANPWEDEVRGQLAESGVTLFEEPGDVWSLLLLRLDRPEEVLSRYTGAERTACFFAVVNVVCEVIGGRFPCEGCQPAEAGFCFVLRCPAGEESSLFDAEGLIEQAQEHIRRIFGFSVSAAVLAPAPAPQGFAARYESLCALSRYLFVTGENSLIDESYLDGVDNEYALIDSRQKKNLLEALRTGSLDRASQVYREISDEAARHSFENMMNTYLHLAYLLYNEYGYSLDLETSNFATMLIPFMGKISKLQTKDQVDQAFLELFSEILRCADESARNRTGSLVEELQALIEENCGDKNLSLNTLAARVEKSPAYIGRLFKEKTNRSVSEYILFVRMEKLRVLLNTTDQPVNILLDQVGLEKTNYFYTLFKKHFGVPLSAYDRRGRDDGAKK